MRGPNDEVLRRSDLPPEVFNALLRSKRVEYHYVTFGEERRQKRDVPVISVRSVQSLVESGKLKHIRGIGPGAEAKIRDVLLAIANKDST